MSSALTKPQDFDLKECSIVWATGEVTDIRASVVEFNYYEDIFGNCTSGKLMLSDSMNISEKLSTAGDEFLRVSIDKPFAIFVGNKPLNKIFRIYNTKEKNLTKDSNQNMVIHFCSEEIFLSQQYKISKAYKKARIMDIVKDIAFTFLKIRPEEFPDKNIIPTMGTYDIIIPNFTPMEAINWLCSFAMAEDSRLIGATYLFYQDRDSWNLKPFLGVYGDFEKYGRLYPDKEKVYWYGSKNDGEKDDDPKMSKFTTIISYQVINSYDTFEAMQDGMFANRLDTVNYISRLHGQVSFDYTKYFEYLKSTIPLYRDHHPFGLMSTAENRFKDTNNNPKDSTIKLVYSILGDSKVMNSTAQATGIQVNNLEKTLQYRYAQTKLISSIRVKITIPGDPNIKIGDTIYIYLKSLAPVQMGSKLDKKKDKFYSGYYFVTALRHRLNQEQEFDTTIECSKDAFESAVDGSDTPGLIPFDNGHPELILARTQGTFES